VELELELEPESEELEPEEPASDFFDPPAVARLSVR
jgi:hypothetical protein